MRTKLDTYVFILHCKFIMSTSSADAENQIPKHLIVVAMIFTITTNVVVHCTSRRINSLLARGMIDIFNHFIVCLLYRK